MKKPIAIVAILFVLVNVGVAQDAWMDSIKYNLSVAKHDTSRMLALAEFSNYYKLKKPDSALIYGYKALTLARKIKYSYGEVKVMEYLAVTYNALGNSAKALQLNLEARKIAERNNMGLDKGLLMFQRAIFYRQSKDYTKALNLLREAKKTFDSVKDVYFPAFTQDAIGETYLAINQLDSALNYCQLAYSNAAKIKESWVTPYPLINLGRIQAKLGNTDTALNYFKQSLANSSEADVLFVSNLSIAQLYQQKRKLDSSIFYAQKAYDLAQKSGFYKDIIDVSLLLSSLYEKANPQQALFYSKKAITYKDIVSAIVQSTAQETLTAFDEQQRQREMEEAKAEFRNRLRINAFLGSTFTLLIIAIFLFRNSKLKQRAKQKVEKAYDQLKATQAQLIQSEKMASLGELTAGIAHEIQNPLNFVNNFSETNAELIEEAEAEFKSGNNDEGLALLNDIQENEKKINLHGRRADAIVKSMLEHSRTSKGEKQSIDINALVDEYLRLAYHGFRAKNKDFNALIETRLDDNIGKINLVPQEIGRVLLNLFNNAFYAVSEKAKKVGQGYEPTVEVTSKKVEDKVEFIIKDNGLGIPQNAINKIFQPFFTSKPTGQGTGLGLSLSYDIIKAHGGELKVESSEGEGALFTIILPTA